jgi:hypothetical protein
MPVVGLILLTAVGPLSVAAVRRTCARREHLRKILLRCGLAGLASLYALLLAETALRAWFVESNGAGITLASQRWLDRYWHPINARGYRDADVDAAKIAGKKILWVVGDSYAAGWGIENVADRFSDRIAVELGDGWRVFTLAKPGWDTRRQIEAASSFPYRADAIVHAYCLNDAERAAEQTGLRAPAIATLPQSHWGAYLVQHSHLANLIYWRWRTTVEDDYGARYWNFLNQCYADGASWESHEADLATLLQVYRERTANIVAVVIPNLQDIASSRPMTDTLEAWFVKHGVNCVPLADRLADRQPAELTVNRFDPHASPAVHALIAELVRPQINDGD